jgi:hypothetical protein
MTVKIHQLSRVARVALVAALLLHAALGVARADPQRDPLVQARHDLAVSEQVLARMTARVTSARADPATRPDERQRLDEYLVRVRALVVSNRERVEHLEKQHADAPSSTTTVLAPVEAMTEHERVAILDAKLNGSLEAFDQLLLEEARKARTREAEGRASANGGSSGSGAHGANGSSRASSRGAESTASGGAGNGEESGDAPASTSAPHGAPHDGSPGGPVGGREPGGASGSPSAATLPPDVGNGNDDDIVARQIRKAAEAESDPELRKKLWDEYRKYKQGKTSRASQAKSS